MPLRSIIAYRAANQPKTSSILKLNAQSPFQKDVSEYIFSTERCAGRILSTSAMLWGILNKFSVRKCTCSFRRKHRLKIFKQMPQRQASEFLNSFAGFNPAFLESENSSSVPYSFYSTWKRHWIDFVSNVHLNTRNRYHISLIWQVSSQGRRLLTDLISRGAKIRPRPLNTRRSEAVTFSRFIPPAVPSTTPTHGHFVLSPVSLVSRDQDGSSSNSTIDTYDLTEK